MGRPLADAETVLPVMFKMLELVHRHSCVSPVHLPGHSQAGSQSTGASAFAWNVLFNDLQHLLEISCCPQSVREKELLVSWDHWLKGKFLAVSVSWRSSGRHFVCSLRAQGKQCWHALTRRVLSPW